MMTLTNSPRFGGRSSLRLLALCSAASLFLPVLSATESAAAQRPVFDLVANRTLAHIELRDGLYIAAGSPGAVRYFHFGRPSPTLKRATVDGKKVALAQASARLDVPLTEKQAQGKSVFLRLKSQARSSVKIAAAGKTTVAVALEIGWQTIEVPLVPGMLKAGENALSLTFAQVSSFAVQGNPAPARAAVAIEWMQIGGTAPKVMEESAPKIADGNKLLIPVGGALQYYVYIPAGGGLRAIGEKTGCTVKVSVDGPKGPKEPAKELSLDGTPLSFAAGTGGDVRRLTLSAQGTCNQLALHDVSLLGTGDEKTVAKPAKPKNVIIWLSDDTRADKFKLWNKASRVETPVLDEWSQRATRFSVTYAQGNESRVSHASLFTGLYPVQHKFISGTAVLGANLVILPEAAKLGGLYTHAHIANGYISKRWGFGDGWDFMKNHIHEGGGLRGGELVADAKTFITKGAGKSKPFFLYLGTIDAHVSWRAYEPWISKYDPKPYAGPFVKGCMDPQLDKIVAGQLPITPRDRERVIALYDSDISYNDQQFGELLKILKASGKEEDTLIIYTSDHGEEFWDHGRIGHGQSLRQELIHIPLWVYYPPLFPGGRVVEEGAELVDILPTITDALGVELPKDVQGESLIPLAQGVLTGYPRPAVASQYELAHTMRLGKYKLWVGGSGQVKLYDGQNDLGEQYELSEKEPLALRFVTDALSLFMAYQDRWKKSRWGVASNQRAEFAQDLEK